MDNNKREQFRNLKIEDIIWIIYFFIIGANLYSNYLQENNLFAPNIVHFFNKLVYFNFSFA